MSELVSQTPVVDVATPVAPPLSAPGLPQRRLYVRVRTRFVATVTVALAWAALSTWLALPWIRDLADLVTLPLAVAVVAGLAIVPGYLNLHLVASLLLDRPRSPDAAGPFPPLTLLIAAFNEEEAIEETVRYAVAQTYPAEVEIVVADDGSSDRTAEIVAGLSAAHGNIRLVRAPHGGKARALNTALATVETPLVATIDADTLLMPYAVKRAVGRLLASPPDTVAVAGSVLVRNSRANLLARVQEWDYFLAIASVKRQQALLQGTLVAQGAFSVYDTGAVKRAGGWPDRIGEDIVLTWSLIRAGGRTTFEPTAVAFTEVPTRLAGFVRQRQRWARGMIEGLREHGVALLKARRLHTHAIGVNLVFPFLDGVYTLAVPPGIVLAATGNFAIIGPMTLAVLPLSLSVAGVMLHLQRRVFKGLGLRIRRNVAGFVFYLLLYQLLMSPISFAGYIKELTRARRVW